MRCVIAALAVVVLTIAGCSSSADGSATPDPAIAFCSALDDYAATLDKLDALTPSSTVAEYTQAVDAAKAALAEVTAVAGPFQGPPINEAQLAQENLTAAAAQLPPGASPADAESTLQSYLQALIVEVTGVRVATCNFSPTPPPAS